jgi:SAM-dependent methyltransferase
MRHFLKAHESGFALPLNSVAELGPGDSLGIGLCAVLTGSNNYWAFDVKQHAPNERNILILDELIDMFQRTDPIPDDNEFPSVSPKLSDYSWPANILTKSVMSRNLEGARLVAIRNALLNLSSYSDIKISYVAPWNSDSINNDQVGHIDMIFSQAVMEHVEDVEGTYRDLYNWLRPGGFMSHTIDYKSHDLTCDWNGRWTVSDGMWKAIKGNRPYFINRLPHSAHVQMITNNGFEIVLEAKRRNANSIRRDQVAPRFADLTDDDFSTSGVFVQAIRPF